jgi:hypothetical protein
VSVLEKLEEFGEHGTTLQSSLRMPVWWVDYGYGMVGMALSDYSRLVALGRGSPDTGYRESWWYRWGAEDVDMVAQLQQIGLHVHRRRTPWMFHVNDQSKNATRAKNPAYYNQRNRYPKALPIVPLTRRVTDPNLLQAVATACARLGHTQLASVIREEADHQALAEKVDRSVLKESHFDAPYGTVLRTEEPDNLPGRPDAGTRTVFTMWNPQSSEMVLLAGPNILGSFVQKRLRKKRRLPSSSVGADRGGVGGVLEANPTTAVGDGEDGRYIATPPLPELLHTGIGLRTKLRNGCQAAANTPNAAVPRIEIWSFAHIGDYLWEHVLHAGSAAISREYDPWDDNHPGAKMTMRDCLQLRYRAGPAVSNASQPSASAVQRFVGLAHLVLVLDASTEATIARATQWLDLLPEFPSLDRVGLVVHGHAGCEKTDFIMKYVDDARYKVAFVFQVFAGPQTIHEKVFPWPLGVSTPRGFPSIYRLETEAPKRLLDVMAQKRKWLCNFYGTAYDRTSRRTMLNAFGRKVKPNFSTRCNIRVRKEWTMDPPSITFKSASSTRGIESYISAIATSMYTLAPAGNTSETPRWYESAALGSTPIIEDVTKPRQCSWSPTDLLKRFKAPFVFVRSWADLPLQLAELDKQPAAENQAQSQRLMAWYHNFTLWNQDRFISAVASKMLRLIPEATASGDPGGEAGRIELGAGPGGVLHSEDSLWTAHENKFAPGFVQIRGVEHTIHYTVATAKAKCQLEAPRCRAVTCLSVCSNSRKRCCTLRKAGVLKDSLHQEVTYLHQHLSV